MLYMAGVSFLLRLNNIPLHADVVFLLQKKFLLYICKKQLKCEKHLKSTTGDQTNKL